MTNHIEFSRPPHSPARTPESRERLRLWLKLLKAARFVESEVRDRFRSEFGLTLPRFDVLAAIDRAGRDMRMSELSSALRVSNGNVTGIVDRLVCDGYLQRVAVPDDRRAMTVRLTNEGRTLFDRTAAAHETWIDEILSGIDHDDARQMIALLGRIGDRAAAGEPR